MANTNPIYKVTDTELTSVANAIRAKTGITTSLSYPGGMVSALKNFSSMPYTLDNILDRNITELEGSTSATVIPSYCFANYSRLTEVNSDAFPNCTHINDYAFFSCSSLQKVDLPNCAWIGSAVFSGCRVLSSINFPTCSYMRGSAFMYCSSLQEANFPVCSFISDAFSYCYRLNTVNFPVCSFLGNYAFYQCSSLISVSFPSCRYIGQSAFALCINLSSINLPACSYIGTGAFSGCTVLNVASFPACSYISSNVFNKCYNLKSLYILSTAVVSLSNSNAFSSTPIGGYTTSAGVYGSIYVPTSLAATYKTAINWSAFSSRIVGI